MDRVKYLHSLFIKNWSPASKRIQESVLKYVPGRHKFYNYRKLSYFFVSTSLLRFHHHQSILPSSLRSSDLSSAHWGVPENLF